MRTRVSTTVNPDLLQRARALQHGATDAALLDAALAALIENSRSAQIDDAYAAAYDQHPLSEPDAWGDVASFRTSAAAT